VKDLRVLIVAEHASARFGGEAILPLHYFRLLRRRGIDARLVVHARTRDELTSLFPDDLSRISFVPDTKLHVLLDRWGKRMPPVVEHITVGWLSRLITQQVARKMSRRLVRRHKIQVIHQPIPVSPKETSILHGLGAPLIIGPMNGGMSYPPTFAGAEAGGRRSVTLARRASEVLNRVFPGKLRAKALLVANDRTRGALPTAVQGDVITLVENGVDLNLWTYENSKRHGQTSEAVRFIFTGRLVDWKAIDLLIEAFARVLKQTDATLELIGDGPSRSSLETLARSLGIEGKVIFSGWQSQAECARRMRSSDVFVLPSLKECGGAVVLEAMASGLPVVATAWGGPLDYLDPSCGILVPPDSRDSLVHGLSQAMLQLAKDPALRQQMGNAGREKVVQHFDWDRKVDRMLEIYEQVARNA
jgi:glycosyltransferase involved in cell wall biosynthesis